MPSACARVQSPHKSKQTTHTRFSLNHSLTASRRRTGFVRSFGDEFPRVFPFLRPQLIDDELEPIGVTHSPVHGHNRFDPIESVLLRKSPQRLDPSLQGTLTPPFLLLS